ncbi:MAG: hypothetical protein AABX70_07115 [Nanoarchaeota archaeon]
MNLFSKHPTRPEMEGSYKRLVETAVLEARDLVYMPEDGYQGAFLERLKTHSARLRSEIEKTRASVEETLEGLLKPSSEDQRIKIEAVKERLAQEIKIAETQEIIGVRYQGLVSFLQTTLPREVHAYNTAVKEVKKVVLGDHWTEWGQRRHVHRTYGSKLQDPENSILAAFSGVLAAERRVDKFLEQLCREIKDPRVQSVLGGYEAGAVLEMDGQRIMANSYLTVGEMNRMNLPIHVNRMAIEGYRRAEEDNNPPSKLRVKESRG